MADGDGIDLYADVDDFNQASTHDHVADANESDLYDAMVTTSAEDSEEPKQDILITKQDGFAERRSSVYVGNLTWWTSDQDMLDLVADSGVTDLIEIKFHENRLNGQSKGFATVVVGSENSANMLLTKLPKRELHGKPVIVTPFTRQNLKMFDAQAPSRPVTNGDQHPSVKSSGRMTPPASTPIPRQHHPQQPQQPQQQQQQSAYQPRHLPSSGIHPPGPVPPHGQGMILVPSHGHGPPPPGMHMAPQAMVMTPSGPAMVIQVPPSVPSGVLRHGDVLQLQTPGPDWNGPPLRHHYPGAPPPPGSMHHNFIPGGLPVSSHHVHYPVRYSGPPGRANERYGRPTASSSFYSSSPYPRREVVVPKVSDAEFEEILQRNKTISSGAISRAIQDAAAGDFEGAIETLVTAISLIRQSKIAEDERCKVHISSLQDTLQGIEQRSYETKVLHKPRSYSRERSGSCDSDYPNSRPRSRSRQRSSEGRIRSKSPLRSRSRHRSRSRGSEYGSGHDRSRRDSPQSRRGVKEGETESRSNRL